MKKAICIIGGLLCAFLSMASQEKVSIQSKQGKLSAIIQRPSLPPNKKCPIVILMHGFGSRKDDALIQSLAYQLEEQGIASIRFDFNAHGESEGKFEEMTIWNEIEDAKNIYNYIADLDFVSQIGLLGHSQGGVVASMLAGELGKKIKALVLMAPATILREDAIRGNTFGTPYDATNPPEFVQLFNGLKLGRSFIITAQNLPIYSTAKKFKGKVCLIHGMEDRLVPYTCSENYQQVYSHSILHLLPLEDHGFFRQHKESTAPAILFFKENLK